MRSLLAVPLAGAVAILVAEPRPAAACTPYFNVPVQVNGNPGDTVAPAMPVVYHVDVGRKDLGGTCGDLAWIDLGVEATDRDVLGFEITHRSGALPSGCGLPTGPVTRNLNLGSLRFYFNPGERHLDFELEVRAVDSNGNRSAPTVVAIIDDAPGGCAAGPSRPQALGPVLIALALLGVRRRRTRA